MSDDCISRQAALDAIDRWCMGEGDEGIYTIVENLPSVTPKNTVSAEVYKQVARERDIAIEQLNELGYEFGEKIEQPKTGHWIRWYEQKESEGITEYIPHCKCSECDKEYDPHSSQFIKYCNKCGAKMVEPQESEG